MTVPTTATRGSISSCEATKPRGAIRAMPRAPTGLGPKSVSSPQPRTFIISRTGCIATPEADQKRPHTREPWAAHEFRGRHLRPMRRGNFRNIFGIEDCPGHPRSRVFHSEVRFRECGDTQNTFCARVASPNFSVRAATFACRATRNSGDIAGVIASKLYADCSNRRALHCA